MRSLIPNSTPVPNIILDVWMPFLSGSELAVLMFVGRKTYGWGKSTDRIGTAQMVDGTGLSRRAVIMACDSLASVHILSINPSGDGVTASEYGLQFDADERILAALKERLAGGAKIAPVQKKHAGGAKIAPVGGAKIAPTRDIRERHYQETLGEECATSAPASASDAPSPQGAMGQGALFEDVPQPNPSAETPPDARRSLAADAKLSPSAENQNGELPPPRGRRAASLAPGCYEHPAMIRFAAFYQQQKGRYPTRDRKTEMRAEKLWNEHGTEVYERALTGYFSCLDNTDGWPENQGYDLTTFVRQFDHWEGGSHEQIHGSQSSRNSQAGRSSRTGAGNTGGQTSRDTSSFPSAAESLQF